MELRKIWQIAAGPASRSYGDIFLKYGVGLIGPGDAGQWKPERNDEEFEGGFVRRFASEANIGDIILLRTGISKISAVGIMASEYQYLNQIDDVNGWDLQHARRAQWGKLVNEFDFEKPIFGANPPRFSRTWNDEVIDFAERFLKSPPFSWQTAPLPELPTEEPELINYPENLQGIISEVKDLFPQYLDSKSFGEPPSEDEMISHFVIPFLRSLGWPIELISIKWRYIDVAVFKSLPRKPGNCHLVIEAKRINSGVEGALAQAKKYVTDYGISCDVVVTDGIRYRMYSCQNDLSSLAYANLARLKESAIQLFSKMKRQ